jgi:hypothetical protein
MGGVAKLRFAVVFLMIFTACLSLGLPAEDVLDAVYDELEVLPYEVIPLSISVPPMAARTTQAPLSSLHHKPCAPSLFAPARTRDADANRSADARTLAALLCILLC